MLAFAKVTNPQVKGARMSIIRRKRSENFTVIPNSIFDDEFLSFEAKSILVFLLSRPDNWRVNTKHLQKITGFGRDKVRSFITELVERTYIERHSQQNEAGLFTGQELVVRDFTDCDFPENYGAPENQGDGHGEPDNGATDEPSYGKSGRITNTNSITSTELDKKNIKKKSNPEVDEAFELYNLMAHHHSWPLCQSKNVSRVASMKKRLKECGGIDGWKAALDLIPRSDFLMNRTNMSFTMKIDFLLQASSFTKLMEGNYTNRQTGRRNASVADLAMQGLNE